MKLFHTEMGRLCASMKSLLALACALLVVLGPRASAGDVQAMEVEGVDCIAMYSGPAILNHGYFAVAITLQNNNADATVVAIEAEQQYNESDRIRRRTQLGGGERHSFEMLLRARTGSASGYTLTFTVDGEEGELRVGPDEYSRGDEIPVMYYSKQRARAGAAEGWQEEWNKRSKWSGYVFGAATFEELSEEWTAYSCFDAVVLSTDDGLPRAQAMGALLAWCRSGGRLILSGADPRAALAGNSGVTKWLRPEYELESSVEAGERLAYHMGQGVIGFVESSLRGAEVMEEDLLEDQPAAFAAVESVPVSRWQPGGYSTIKGRAKGVMAQLGVFERLPLRGLMALLILFALLMGPVNFIWVKRMKKPMLLLVTVPAIAICTSVALVLYGVVSQGLDVKVVTHSYTFLDQLESTATTAEVRRLFAGSSPGEGLRPDRNTAIFPPETSWRGSRRQANLYTQDLTEGRILGGEYLPVRKPTAQLLLSDRTSRLRLEVTSVGEDVEVSNALGGELERLVLRDERGEWFHLKEALGAGGSRRLVPGTVSLAERSDWEPVLKKFWGETPGVPEGIPPGSYMAVVDSDEFLDPCGISVTTIDSQHTVFGVFAMPQGEGR